MLNVPKLDDLSYQQIFEQARSLIPGLTKEWTDFNYPDPGVTMLQTFAWLTDNLNFYMDATGDIHRRKYMKLLGIRPEKSPARCVLELRGQTGEICLARGTKFAAGEVVFEALRGYHGAVNRLRRVYRQAGGAFIDLTRFAGQDGDFARIFSEEGEKLYLGFESPLSGHAEFYAEISAGMARNPFDRAFSLAVPDWEYYDGARWRPAPIESDETGGLLKSGSVRLWLDGVTAALENPLLDAAHYLRCGVIRGGYDVPPRLGRVVVNHVEACQTDTKTQTLEYEYQGEDLRLDAPVSEEDFLTVAVGADGEYTVWYEFEEDANSLCAVEQGEQPWERVVRFDRQRFGIAPDPGGKVLVVILSPEMAGEHIIGITNGCANQRFDLPIADICTVRVALTTRQNGRTVYRMCDDWGELSRADGYDWAFEVDWEANQIVFGDGIHGIQPERGMTVELAALQTSLLDRGNVRRGTVNRMLTELAGHCGVSNPEDASGGRRPETAAELEQRVEEKMNAVRRAVTREDYRRIVLETPGLLIDSVNVISMKDYCAAYPDARECPNTVILAVKPRTEEPRPKLGEAYRQLILENLEQYRLLTTHLVVVPARYVAVTAYGRLLLRENTQSARAVVEETIRSMVEAEKDAFGRAVALGKVFSMLELLGCVRKVARFSFEYEGEGGRKNDRGDIEIFPDSIAYLAGFGIEYI